MRAVVQRVTSARVDIAGKTVGEIGSGLLIFASIGKGDTPAEIDWMARKCAGLRIFPDEEGKMNRSVQQTGGSCLVVSQFTLYADCAKGFRPGFSSAAPPEEGSAGYEAFVTALRDKGLPVETGVFQADMQVSLINDGPVTLLLEKGVKKGSGRKKEKGVRP